MPLVVILDTSLSMLRRPFPEADFTYFSVAQALIESFIKYIRRHQFMELMSFITASSRPQVRAPFSRRDSYVKLLDEVMSVSVEDKADYGRAIALAHSSALSTFGAAGVPIDVILFTDEGALIHGIPDVPEQMEDDGVIGGLPFRFPGNLYIVSVQGNSKSSTNQSAPFENFISLNNDHGKVVRLKCAQTLSDCVDSGVWPRLFPVQYGELRCGWLRADVQAHPTIRHLSYDRFQVRVAGFVSPEDVSSPAVISKHLLLPVIPKTAATENGDVEGLKSEGKDEVELWYPCGTTEDDWKSPQFTALLHGSLASKHMLALVEMLPLRDSVHLTPPKRQFALLHSELSSATTVKRSNLTLSILNSGVDVIPWMGQLSYLAPVADFDRPPSGNVFPMKSMESRSYAIGSGHVCWLWGNMTLDVSKVMKHARRLTGAADGSANSVTRVNAFYSDVNRVRSAALAFGASSLLTSLKTLLEREASSAQDATTKHHLKHVSSQMLLPYESLKRIEQPPAM